MNLRVGFYINSIDTFFKTFISGCSSLCFILKVIYPQSESQNTKEKRNPEERKDSVENKIWNRRTKSWEVRKQLVYLCFAAKRDSFGDVICNTKTGPCFTGLACLILYTEDHQLFLKLLSKSVKFIDSEHNLFHAIITFCLEWLLESSTLDIE